MKNISTKRTRGETTSNIVEVVVHEDVGWLEVYHNGNVTWDELQEVKNRFFGRDAVAIEVYPPEDRVVNALNVRHLWRLGKGEFWPDIRDMGRDDRTLAERFGKLQAECA